MTSLLTPAHAGNVSSEMLREAETFVKSALDALTSHVAILDSNGVIIHVNAAWRQFADANHFDSNQNYGLGMNYLTVCDSAAATSKDAALVARGLRSIIQGQQPEFYLEYPCHSPQERRWFVVRVSRFEWYGHIRLIVSHQNVTEIKRVQMELADSQRRLQAILDNLVDGVITFDQHGVIESINPAGAAIFGYRQDEIVNQNLRLLLPGLEAEAADDAALIELLGRLGSLGDELVGRRKDGSFFPLYFAVSQMRLDRRLLFTAVIQDFTERKYLETQLWEKERLNMQLDKERDLRDLKNRFISMMSHELRTPLSAIKLAASSLKAYGDRLSQKEKAEAFDTIETQVERMAELIADVMTITRTEFTGTEFNPEIVDLETYCRDIVEEIQLAYRMKRPINFSGLNRRVEARIDKKLLRRALTNLLTNAIKYSPEDKAVDISLSEDHDRSEAMIRVSDRGIGIPEHDLKTLFEPFHRASNVGQIQGTGLGLAIAKQAIELHGGTISVESRLGKGTTFTVRLPLLTTTEQPL